MSGWKRKRGVSGPGESYGYERREGGWYVQVWKRRSHRWWAVSLGSEEEQPWDAPSSMTHGFRSLAEAKAEGDWLLDWAINEAAPSRPDAGLK